MKNLSKVLLVLSGALLVFFTLVPGVFSQTGSPTTGNIRYAAFPPSNSESAAPLVMLTLSRDHQYFFKAFNDFTDLDPELNDGLELTYKHSFDYYGYFDHQRCYTYSTTDKRFKPTSNVDVDRYCTEESNSWNGNFLNWSTMTRMDIIRKIFYGGFRSTDDASLTVLERAFLPTDAHSFAKYYNGLDIPQLTPYDLTPDNDGVDEIGEGITICNTTYSTSNSQDATDPPLMRVAKGNYQLWAANERYQCTWDNEHGDNSNGNKSDDSGIFAHSSDPNNSDALPNTGKLESATNSNRDHVVRVEVCSSGDAGANDNERCQEYPNGNQKPIGLLHLYGETGLMDFGLITGSYEKNTQGGVLRKNISTFTDEVNSESDGTFTGSDGIVSTIDLFRMYGYRANNGTYFGGGGDNCGFQLTDIVDGDCNSWGNPLSEIYGESIRYFANKTATNAFDVDDKDFIVGLTEASWSNPQTVENQCSPLNNIVVNASVNSYDDDANGVFSDLPGSPDWKAQTDNVGAHEGINGTDRFIGEIDGSANAAEIDQYCTSKKINKLSNARGVCPEAPTVQGSYGIAGMSYYARNNDLRTDIGGNQTVTTYGITLATNSPAIRIPSGEQGQNIIATILPAYRLQRGDEGGGALVDFKIVEPHNKKSENVYGAKYYLNWEDSEQGGDYDNDLWGTLEYELNISTGKLTITTDAISETTNQPQLFGFITNGTTEDGFHAYSGIEGANFTDPSNAPGCNNCQIGDPSVSYTFTLDSSVVAEILQPPLYYAAKYGSFEDAGADGADSDSEWDATSNSTGELGSDGVPDNYFSVVNPAQLEESLALALSAILADRASSGTAPANLANADGSGGLIVQALYFDNQESKVNESEAVTWLGQLEAFYIDDNGFFREDNPTQGTRFELDGYDVDKVFEFDYQEGLSETLRIRRFDLEDPTKDYNPIDPDIDYTNCGDLDINGDVLLECPNELDRTTVENVPASELNTLWSAGDSLSSLNNVEIIKQRDYSTAELGAGGPGRNIITWFDKNRNRQVDEGEQIDFVRDSAGLKDDQGVVFGRYLTGSNNLNPAKKIIDFVRGKDGLAGMRSRSLTELDESGTSVKVVKRLGDIVNSTPVIVGAPDSAYNAIFGDPTYDEFLRKYNNRRQVMYIGGNDGLLHAFNVGFRKSSLDSALSFSSIDPADATKTQHALGAELWAYAPKNLLPHLRWLTQPLYQHVFYVDGEPKSYDVNIFTPDEDHPNGWGTILVVGMRLGGGQFGVKLDGDNANDLERPGQPGVRAGCRDWCARSSYVVLDITNPEKPPKILAEINDNLLATFDSDGQVDLPANSMQHTVTAPTLVKQRVPSAGVNFISPSVNEWKLVFGNGVQSRDNFNTGQSAKLYTYDLISKNLSVSAVTGNGVPKGRSFIGGLTSVDWNGDFQDDMVYFGTVGASSRANDVDNFRGGLFRYSVDNGSTNAMFNANRPISVEPIAQRLSGRQMVYFGTGRYYHQNDEVGEKQESFYALKEPINGLGLETYSNNNVMPGNILNSTSIVVDESGALSGSGAPAGVTTFTALQNEIINNPTVHGWKRDLELGTLAAPPNERVSTDAATFRTQLFYTSFIPDPNLCAATSGESFLSVVDLITGTASAFGALGFDNVTGEAITSISTGKGRASSPQLVVSSGRGSNKGTIIIQQDTGELKNPAVITGAKSVTERINWREIRSD